MALELTTIGIKLGYAAETTAGTKPSTFTDIPNITSIGEMSAQPDQLDCSNLADTWKRYVQGQKDSGGNIAVGANFTKAFLTLWNTIVSAYATAHAAGKAMWFEVEVTGFGAFYFTGEPAEMGLPGIEVNQVFAGTVNITPNSIAGWTAEA